MSDLYMIRKNTKIIRVYFPKNKGNSNDNYKGINSLTIFDKSKRIKNVISYFLKKERKNQKFFYFIFKKK